MIEYFIGVAVGLMVGVIITTQRKPKGKRIHEATDEELLGLAITIGEEMQRRSDESIQKRKDAKGNTPFEEFNGKE